MPLDFCIFSGYYADKRGSMIAYIEGRVAEVTPQSCVLATAGGLGYEVFLTARDLAGLPERGGEAAFYTSLVVREDANELFGFRSFEERRAFLILTSISRVGAKTAMSVLSVFRPAELHRLVAEEDPLALTAVPGIGKKSAQQIFLELKYKLKMEDLPAGTQGHATSGVLRDALSGLAGLGYSEDEGREALGAVLAAEPDLDVSAALRAALKKLAKK
jgi:Holliday junction DNA helicase RuvA